MTALSLIEQPARVTTAYVRAVEAEHLPFHMLSIAPADDGIDAAIGMAEAALMPAGEAAALKGIDYATRLLSSKPLAEDLLAGYAAILAPLPNDLLGRAIRDACAGTTYHKLPVPGVFLDLVKKDLADRKAALSTLKRHRERIQLLHQMRPQRGPQLALVAPVAAK